ncbi:hypothetical protein HOY82DRAFT_415305 [Tuber indicum]|nr:hypothetical protein HOY82DRAFT_415305 [Tuber indicum]
MMKFPIGEDKDIGSGDAFESHVSRFSGFKTLGGLTAKEVANEICGMVVIDDSSFEGEPGADLADQVILNEEKGSGKDDTSDADSNLLCPNELGGTGTVMRAPKIRELSVGRS